MAGILQYTPLDPSKWQIRVLHLLPGSPGSIIQCELHLHTLTDFFKYAALSYCWGDETNRRRIILDNAEITVTVNLDKALKKLRALDVQFLWADALCINQNDLVERSLQVRLMKQIYSQAEITYAWLGDEVTASVAQALLSLKQLPIQSTAVETTQNTFIGQWGRTLRTDISKLGLLTNTEESPSELDDLNTGNVQSMYEAFLFLLEQPYWQRRWIIQEAAISESTMVICGDVVLDFAHLFRAMTPYTQDQSRWTTNHKASYEFLAKIAKIRHACYYGRRPALLDTMLDTRRSLSKDSRDKVFALIGICKDGDELVPTPSYEGTPEAVSIHLTREFLKRNTAFEVILAGGKAKNRNSALPTWCPDWLSGELSPDVYHIANQSPLLALRFGRLALRDMNNRIRIQGIEIGTVVAMTSVLDSSASTGGTPVAHQSIPQSTPHPAQMIQRNGHLARAALSVCLCGNIGLRQSVVDRYHSYQWHVDHNLEFQMLLALSQVNARVRRADFLGPRWPSLQSWIAVNKDFIIEGQTLGKLCNYQLNFLRLPLVKQWLINPKIFGKGGHFTWLASFVIFGCSIAVGVRVSLVGFLVLFLISVLGIISGFVLVVTNFRCTYRYELINGITERPTLSQARLVVLNTGDMALACSEVEIGDKLCFIAGCDSTAVLRQEASADSAEQLHSVVGYSFVNVTRDDQQRYEAFLGGNAIREAQYERDSQKRYNRHTDYVKLNYQTYNRLINEHTMRRDWKHFTLI